MERQTGQRWIFDNLSGNCGTHIDCKAIFEVTETLSVMPIQVIQANQWSERLRPNMRWLIDSRCGCFKYLEGQDKP